jgi:hypothetical protein
MYLILLGGLFIWFIETIILTLIYTRKNTLLIKKRLLIFFGTGIISPIAYMLFGWLTMLILKMFNLLDNPDLLDTWLLIPYGFLMLTLFFGTPLLTLKLIIKILTFEKKNPL